MAYRKPQRHFSFADLAVEIHAVGLATLFDDRSIARFTTIVKNSIYAMFRQFAFNLRKGRGPSLILLFDFQFFQELTIMAYVLELSSRHFSVLRRVAWGARNADIGPFTT